ncbi:unnamed protein product [Notodromas monacha]|uniref:Uncharacterized protein n=1 Tax=Notodromas monacha TaxID=399045 RepID=A0A7R9GFN9_9CRUS|nr:unnamed protein product [Notodromas monacha]CAG0919356.1 unnamed protein product [Notodromas monacha]
MMLEGESRKKRWSSCEKKLVSTGCQDPQEARKDEEPNGNEDVSSKVGTEEGRRKRKSEDQAGETSTGTKSFRMDCAVEGESRKKRWSSCEKKLVSTGCQDPQEARKDEEPNNGNEDVSSKVAMVNRTLMAGSDLLSPPVASSSSPSACISSSSSSATTIITASSSASPFSRRPESAGPQVPSSASSSLSSSSSSSSSATTACSSFANLRYESGQFWSAPNSVSAEFSPPPLVYDAPETNTEPVGEDDEDQEVADVMAAVVVAVASETQSEPREEELCEDEDDQLRGGGGGEEEEEEEKQHDSPEEKDQGTQSEELEREVSEEEEEEREETVKPRDGKRSSPEQKIKRKPAEKNTLSETQKPISITTDPAKLGPVSVTVTSAPLEAAVGALSGAGAVPVSHVTSPNVLIADNVQSLPPLTVPLVTGGFPGVNSGPPVLQLVNTLAGPMLVPSSDAFAGQRILTQTMQQKSDQVPIQPGPSSQQPGEAIHHQQQQQQPLNFLQTFSMQPTFVAATPMMDFARVTYTNSTHGVLPTGPNQPVIQTLTNGGLGQKFVLQPGMRPILQGGQQHQGLFQSQSDGAVYVAVSTASHIQVQSSPLSSPANVKSKASKNT